jgi:putative ABC transport system ATP-binding protein
VTAVLDVSGVSKDYRGLRPLRIHQLSLGARERVALLGFDQVSAEVFVNLVTGATLPDTGRVSVFGRLTSEIADSDEWLRVVDRFGIVSERAVLLDSLTAVQNLAMPFTLDFEPLTGATRDRVEALAGEIQLPGSSWEVRVSELAPIDQMRVRVGRALALQPELLLLEHVSARLDASGSAALARVIGEVAGRRGISLVAMTADEPFARTVAPKVLRWEGATGRLSERRGWFGSLLG